MRIARKKVLTVVMCAAGIVLIAHGMYKGNNPVFLVGLLLFVIGYLFVRKELKKTAERT